LELSQKGLYLEPETSGIIVRGDEAPQGSKKPLFEESLILVPCENGHKELFIRIIDKGGTP
jgi:hypothetical protein